MNPHLHYKSFLVAMLLTVVAQFCFAGGSNGSGGDPRVAEFLAGAQVACSWMKKDTTLGMYASKCFVELNDLINSVNLYSRTARITSTSKVLRDEHGILKDATTDLINRTVTISIPRWKQESQIEHEATSVMEISLLIGIPNRYHVAKLFLKDATVEHTQQPSTPCSTTLDAMASLIDSYIETIKACYSLEKSGLTNSLDYKQQMSMAQSIEFTYAKDVAFCHQVCADPVASCDGPAPLGSCKVRP